LAARLGGRLEPPGLSWKYDWIRRLFGWGPAKTTQEYLRRVKWSTLRRWDRLLVRVPGRNPGISRSLATPPLSGRRAAVLLFSYYPADPRPRRAAEALVAEGMRVEVICLRQSKNEPPRETCNGVDVLRLPLRRRRGGPSDYLVQYPAFIVSTFFLLVLRSLRRRFALIHVHNMPDVLVFSALVPKALGARVILDLHDPMPELMTTIYHGRLGRFASRLLEQLERWSIRVADVVFTANVAFKRLFASRSCHPAKIHVIMNSPDEEIFSFRSPQPGRSDPGRPFVIMYHGSIVERNGLDVAITALETVRRSVPRAELRIYGEPTPFLESLMETVRQRGLQDAIRFLGAKSLPEIVSAIDDCDVGIIPNRRTVFTQLNMPTRIFEYLSRGKPAITGRAPGVQDYFPDDALFFFELGDGEDLARSIRHVYHHPDDVDRVVRRGQEVYLAHRWSGERSRLVGEIERLLSSAPTRQSSASPLVVGGHSR
jgi:glycosyltransferase involved in cell wall biosynthesis